MDLPKLFRWFRVAKSLLPKQEAIMVWLISPVQKILCRYTNTTSRIQILRISDIPNEYEFFERSIMPKRSILFEAFRDSHLEIHTSEMMSAVLSDTIPCAQLSEKAAVKIQRSLLAVKSA